MSKKRTKPMTQATSNERGQRIALVQIDCPPEIFDAPDAYILRRKRCPVAKLDAMKTSKTAEELYDHMADLIPQWHNIVDVETGELLPNPEEDPQVFGRIDAFEQLVWLSEKLQVKPSNPNGSGPART